MISYHVVINNGPWLMVQVNPEGLGEGAANAFMELLKNEIALTYENEIEEKGELIYNQRFPSKSENYIHSLLIRGGVKDAEQIFALSWENLKQDLRDFFNTVLVETEKQTLMDPGDLVWICEELQARSRENGVLPSLNWVELLREKPEETARFMPFNEYERRAISELVKEKAEVYCMDLPVSHQCEQISVVQQLQNLQTEFPGKLNEDSLELQKYKLMTVGGADPEILLNYVSSLQETLKNGQIPNVPALAENTQDFFFPETLVLDSRKLGKLPGDELIELLYDLLVRELRLNAKESENDDWKSALNISPFRLSCLLQESDSESCKLVLSRNREDGTLAELIRKAATKVQLEDTSSVLPVGDGLIHGNPWEQEVWPKLKSRNEKEEGRTFSEKDWIQFIEANPSHSALFMKRADKILERLPEYNLQRMVKNISLNMKEIFLSAGTLLKYSKLKPGDQIGSEPGRHYTEEELDEIREEEVFFFFSVLKDFDLLAYQNESRFNEYLLEYLNNEEK